MTRITSWLSSGLNRHWLEHISRTTTAATVSLLIARMVALPEAYWAAITTVIVLQSTLGAAWNVSVRRLAGTALGAAVGAVAAIYFGPSWIAFGAGLFLMGLLCAILHLDRTAYRFAGITLAIVMLVVRTRAPWEVAFHRFAEVSLGIAIALVLTALWPEHLSEPTENPAKT